MKEEVEIATRFISRLVNRHEKLEKKQVVCFGRSLTKILCELFNEHWYPDNPLKGQAYRCIRINRKQPVDDSLLKACKACGLDYSELALPKEISIWIDPGEVCCRLGENNQYFTVKDVENTSGKSTPEPETSDYHSESPSENSEDESLVRLPNTTYLGKSRPVLKHSPTPPTQYFYVPTPLWVPCPQSVVSYIPTYQPVLYYVDIPPKSPVPRKPNPNLVKRLTKRASKV
ncbi:protein BTG3-like [Pseudonaja textilis]|uniref:Protein BTG3-like n=1 Tax=Pseudonaja textilis TaxID=8673 RepID=A0A670ZGJ0_PSETE|nr:protein BTG3-like [Pseudonaja textilis]XP_026574542.1 protein BTG3-like [Pseudonaja textilis]